MALSAFTAGETLQEIVADCTRLANCPDSAFDPATKAEPTPGNIRKAPAYRWLLDIIRNLYLDHDWPFAIKAVTLSQVSALCLLLPDDFWRVAYTDPLYALKPPERISLEHVTRPQFFDNQKLANNTPGRPSKFFVSRPDGLIYLDPPPSETWAYELHYFKLVDELTEITEVPQFPHRDYLRQALLIRCYEDQSDSRALAARLDLADIWKRIRSSVYDYRENPEQNNLSMLDPQHFRNVCFDD